MKPDTKTHDLLRKLEQATLPADVDAGAMDEETAQLRESWLALGQILSDSHCEPASLSPMPLPAAPTKRVAKRRIAFYPTFAAAITCAAVLAAVLFGGWNFMTGHWLRDSTQRIVRHDTNSSQNNAESADNASPGVRDRRAAVTDQNASTSESAMELAWDDALDVQLARTQIALWQADAAVTNHEQTWEHLINKFQSISDDLEDGSL